MADTTITVTIPEAQWSALQTAMAYGDDNTEASDITATYIKNRFVNELNVGDIEIVEVPPIESVNYGREVGYDFNELVPPEHIKRISGRKIRNEDDTIV